MHSTHSNSTMSHADSTMPVIPSFPDTASNTTTATHNPADDFLEIDSQDEDDDTFPDGGYKAYFVLVGSFIGLTANFGMLNSVGAIQTYLSINQLQDVKSSTVSWIFSIYFSLAYFGGIVVGPFFDARGATIPLAGGLILIFGGFMAVANSTHVWQFILALSICVGVGNALCITPLVGVVSHWFYLKRGRATGLATTGGSLGGIIIPLMLRGLYPKVGFAWAIRILAFFCLACMALAIVLAKGRLAIFQQNKRQRVADTRRRADEKRRSQQQRGSTQSPSPPKHELRQHHQKAGPLREDIVELELSSLDHHHQVYPHSPILAPAPALAAAPVRTPGHTDPLGVAEMVATTSDEQQLPTAPSTPQQQQQQQQQSPRCNHHESSPSRKAKRLLAGSNRYFNFSNLLDVKYSLLIAGVFTEELALMLIVTYFASYAIRQNMKESSSYLLLTVFNAAGIPGRWLPGYASDIIGYFNVMILMLTGLCVSIFLLWLPFGANHGVLWAFAALGGFFSSSILSLTPVCLGQITPVSQFGERYGMLYFFVSISNLFGLPIGAAIIGDRSKHNYDMFVVLCGVLAVVGTACWIGSRYCLAGFKLNVKV